MKSLEIDIETFSPTQLAGSGVYRYSEDPGFEILLFAYAVDDQPVQVVDLAQGETIPTSVLSALTDPEVVKWAHNATFERVCLGSWLGQPLDPAQWRCTMVWAGYLGLPMSLEACGRVLKLTQQKLTEGKRLIRMFCQPCRPTKTNGGRTRNLPHHQPEDWATFIDYVRRDVEVEQAIKNRLGRLPMPETEWELYAVDQLINDRGVKLDLLFAERAIECDQEFRENRIARAVELTGLPNPNSPIQLGEWLTSKGCQLPDLTKLTVADALAKEELDPTVKEVLELRQQLAKSSVRKYQAMTKVAGPDARARGLLQFNGATRTGRWAGRLIQVQNLPQNHLPDLDSARALVREGLFDALELLYPSTPDTLSELIRTAFIPEAGAKFVVVDYSAIEARVLAWLAGERWRLDLFQDGGDIYCQSASKMFGVPVEKHGINAHLRQKGKVAELACGYGGGVGALTAMGALRMGVDETELQPLVDSWRSANPAITAYWRDIDAAVKHTVTTGETSKIGNLRTELAAGLLLIHLPSGRVLSYVKPHVTTNRFGGSSIGYMGVTAANTWARIESYGPKFVENIVQAIARDLLAYAILTIESAGHHVVMHVHDEVVVETPKHITVEQISALMTTAPAWAAGLPLDADGYTCTSYRKD